MHDPSIYLDLNSNWNVDHARYNIYVVKSDICMEILFTEG